MTLVYTTGVFDMIHPGHLNILRRARALGDRLIVGVQEDDSIEKQKGRKPVMSCSERVAMLEALPFVDITITYADLDQRKILKLIRPDIMVQGSDWQETGDRAEIMTFLKENNIRLIQFPYTKNVSTSDIKNRVLLNTSKV